MPVEPLHEFERRIEDPDPGQPIPHLAERRARTKMANDGQPVPTPLPLQSRQEVGQLGQRLNLHLIAPAAPWELSGSR